jgi:hypothetical protein
MVTSEAFSPYLGHSFDRGQRSSGVGLRHQQQQLAGGRHGYNQLIRRIRVLRFVQFIRLVGRSRTVRDRLAYGVGVDSAGERDVRMDQELPAVLQGRDDQLRRRRLG